MVHAREGEEAASMARAKVFSSPEEAFQAVMGRPPGPNDYFRITTVGTVRERGFYPRYDAGEVIGGFQQPKGHVSVYVSTSSRWGRNFRRVFDYFGAERPILSKVR
jgi:hypothetical protein